MNGNGQQEGKGGGVESVERALTILDAFDKMGRASLTLHELAQATGFYKSTILRLAVSLERFAYLRRREDGRYQPGPACARLAAWQSAGVDKGELLQRAVKDLAHRSGETSSYYVRDGAGRVCMFRENSAQSVRHHVEVGERLPLERGAAGLTLLAFSGAAGERFERIRALGQAESLGERESDAAAIAAPVFDADGTLLGALTISGVITRFTPEAIGRFQALMRETTLTLDREFGVPPDLRPAAPPENPTAPKRRGAPSSSAKRQKQ